jgi:hypothetical protein
MLIGVEAEMQEMSQPHRQSRRLFLLKLALLTSSVSLVLFAAPTYDACKPSLMRLRLTSALKSMSFFSMC